MRPGEQPAGPSAAGSADAGAGQQPRFRYVEELVRHQLSTSLGGIRGMVESALPFIAFTIVWVACRDRTDLPASPLYVSLAAALAMAVVLAVIRLAQRQSLKFVVQAVIPTGIAALVASRTGRAEDIFLPGILYNGVLALVSALTIVIRKPLVGFIIGAATGDPTGWTHDRAFVRLTSKLTAVLAVPYVLRFVLQLPLFLAGQVVLLAIAKVALGWPLLLVALTVMGVMLSRGRTPIEDSAFATTGAVGPSGDTAGPSAGAAVDPAPEPGSLRPPRTTTAPAGRSVDASGTPTPTPNP